MEDNNGFLAYCNSPHRSKGKVVGVQDRDKGWKQLVPLDTAYLWWMEDKGNILLGGHPKRLHCVFPDNLSFEAYCHLLRQEGYRIY